MPVIHLRVTGRVQGVGFRFFVCDRAEELGVSGWVRNTSSGDVEVAASGDSSGLDALEAAVARGPSGARVTAVHRVSPPDGTTYPSPFRIER
jgi:acylphosphatase